MDGKIYLKYAEEPPIIRARTGVTF